MRVLLALLMGALALASGEEEGTNIELPFDIPEAQPMQSRILTDTNFEKLTQAATGQTTGRWLVRFCSSKHPDCQEGQNGWEELSEEMRDVHQIILADVNADVSPALSARFGIQRIPAYLFFSDRKMWRMPGATSDRDEVHEWVTEGTKRVPGQEVPLDPSMSLQEVQAHLQRAAAKARAKVHALITDAVGSRESGRRVQSLAVLAVPVLLACLVTAVLMAVRRAPRARDSKKKD